MAVNMCLTLFAANCYGDVIAGELVYLFTVMCDFACWSILDVLDSRMSVRFWSHVLLAVSVLVCSRLDFSRCQRNI